MSVCDSTPIRAVASCVRIWSCWSLGKTSMMRLMVPEALFGMLDETVTSWILSGKDYDLQRLAAPVVDLLLRGAGATGAVRARPPLRAALPMAGGR